LPAAEGVPEQADWNPTAQLEMLAQRQAQILSQKLGNNTETVRELPTRPLPYGSEGVISPTYLAHAASMASHAHNATNTTASSACSQVVAPSTIIEEPSYTGPGALWEKDETYPQFETPLGPSEEEKDVLMN